MPVHESIRAYRAALGMSQFQLAIRLGVTPTSVFLWEQGKALPRLSNRKKLAEVFGIPVEKLLPELA